MRRILLLSLFISSVVLASAQQTAPPSDQPPVTVTKPYLSPDQIQAAVDRGLNGKPHTAGILIADRESAVQSGMSCNRCGHATYTVRAFTPSQWIESGAMIAKKNNKPFNAASVTPRMRAPAFRVWAYQVRRAAGKMELPDPIQNVQLADAKQKEILKPLKEKESEAKGEHIDTNSSTSGSTEATLFEMTDVDKLSKDGTQDIYVVIITHSGHLEYIKIKAQDLKE
jgi:hypothetical protein